jgi:hypothetical protein
MLQIAVHARKTAKRLEAKLVDDGTHQLFSHHICSQALESILSVRPFPVGVPQFKSRLLLSQRVVKCDVHLQPAKQALKEHGMLSFRTLRIQII